MNLPVTTYKIQKDREKAHVAYLLHEGRTVEEIADVVKKTPAQVRGIIKSDRFKVIVRAQYKDSMSLASKKVYKLYERALQKVDEVFDLDDPELNLKAISEVRKLVELAKKMDDEDGVIQLVEEKTTHVDRSGKILSIKEAKKISGQVEQVNRKING